MWHAPVLVLLTRWVGDKRVTIPIPKYTQEEVVFLKGLIDDPTARKAAKSAEEELAEEIARLAEAKTKA